MSTANRGCARLRNADMLDLASLDEVGQSPYRHFNGDANVDAVNIVQVNVWHAQLFERGIKLLFNATC